MGDFYSVVGDGASVAGGGAQDGDGAASGGAGEDQPAQTTPARHAGESHQATRKGSHAACIPSHPHPPVPLSPPLFLYL